MKNLSQIIRVPKKYKELLGMLSKEDVGNLFLCLFDYEKENNLEGTAKIIFNTMKVDLENLDKSANNGKKGGKYGKLSQENKKEESQKKDTPQGDPLGTPLKEDKTREDKIKEDKRKKEEPKIINNYQNLKEFIFDNESLNNNSKLNDDRKKIADTIERLFDLGLKVKGTEKSVLDLFGWILNLCNTYSIRTMEGSLNFVQLNGLSFGWHTRHKENKTDIKNVKSSFNTWIKRDYEGFKK